MNRRLFFLPAALLMIANMAMSFPTLRAWATESTSTTTDPAEKTREDAITTDVNQVKTENTDTQRLTTLKDLCSKMIDHRIKTLNGLKARVDANTKLTADQKAQIDTTIAAEIAALNTATITCANATTVLAVKTVIRSIEDNHHTFASVIPKLEALVLVNHANAFIGRLNDSVAALQAQIDKAKALSCDTTQMTASLADYKSDITDAQTHMNNAKNIINQIKASQDAGTLRTQLKTEMQAMVAALQKAADAHKAIIAALKTCKTSKSTTTP